MGMHKARALDDIQAHAADAEDSNGLAWLQMCVIEDDPQTRGDGAAKEGRDIPWEIVGNARHTVLDDNRVGAEGGDAARVDKPAILAARLGGGAVDAAPLHPVQHNFIARLDFANA